MNTKNTLAVLAVTGFLGLGILNSGAVYAQENVAVVSKPNFFSAVVDKISATFGLDKAKVQAVVDEVEKEHKATMNTEMKKRQEERLNKLVSEGKITEAQKTAIIKKHEEMRNNFNPETFKNMTEEQRKAAMEKQHADLEAWAQSQGIDPEYLKMKIHMKMGHGFGGRGDKLFIEKQ